MYRRLHGPRNAAFGFGLIAALGFGTTQALAAPGPGQKSVRHCVPSACDRACKAEFFTGGFCIQHSKQCYCYH